LHHAHQPRKDAKHSPFRAGWNQSGRRRLRIQAAIAGAFLGGKHAGLAFEAKDRTVNIGLAGEHAGIVDQITRGEVVGAVGDDVELAKYFQSVLAGQPGLERAQFQKRVDRFELLTGGVELLAPYICRAVDDLALQVGVIHHVEVHDAECAHARSRQIESQRRAQPARANTQHPRCLQLLLPFHADLGHDEMARVAQDFVVGQGSDFGFDIGCGGHKNLSFGIVDF
jgi:hypothetical protein